MKERDNTIELPMVDNEVPSLDLESASKSRKRSLDRSLTSNRFVKKMGARDIRVEPKEIEVLVKEYHPADYDYERMARVFTKRMIEKGFQPPDPASKELPLMYVLYLECLWNILKILAIITVMEAIPIYAIAFYGFKFNIFGILLSNKLYYFIVTPYNFVYQTKLYHILEHFSSPIILIVVSILFIRAIQDFELRMVSEIDRGDNRNSMHCVRLKNLEFKAEDELSCQVDLIMERVVMKDVVLIKDSNLIDEKMEEFIDLEIDYRIILDKLEKKYSSKLEKKKEKVEQERKELSLEIKVTSRKLLSNSLDLRSRYGFVCFHSYEHMQEFRDRLPEIKSEYPKMSKVVALHAPDPYDIDWNHYARKYSYGQAAVHFLMAVLFWLISPAVTYYCQKELSYGLAKAILVISGKDDQTSRGIIEQTYSFMLVRVLASSAYCILCTFLIEKYYSFRTFKTYSAKNRSNFYFYNAYFLVNQVVADFYGVISAGIVDLDQKKSKNILVGYSNYIFSAALKVALMLCLSPYIDKFLDYLPKFWNKIRVKFSCGKSYNLHKVIADLPVEHNIVMTGSFVVQCVFFIGFFQSFLMPFLSLFVVLGLYLFYKFESYMLRNHHARRVSLTLNQVKMLYTTSYFGFLIIQILAIGNIRLVLNYFDDFDLNSLKSLVLKGFDYTVLVILLLLGIAFTYRYREAAIKERIVKKLVERTALRKKSSNEEAKPQRGDVPYEARNPIFKARDGVYMTRFGL